MPTETQLPRLIDANALKGSINQERVCGDSYNLYLYFLELIESAPTVETTDGGWNLLSEKSPEHPGKYLVEIDNGLDDNFQLFNWTSKDAWEKWPVKRWKKLEASINPK